MDDKGLGRDRLALRVAAVRSVIAGESKCEVARRHGVSRQTLHAWCARHRRGGTAALEPRRRGRAPRTPLEPWQEAQAAGAIMLLPPWSVGRGYTRWTKNAIARLIEVRFGVRLSGWMVGSYLRRWGFTSVKQVRQAFRGRGGPAAAPRTRAPAAGEIEAAP